MSGGWNTKEDVIGDLYVVTGSVPEVHDHCFVHGERPPPQTVYEIDDEMKLMYGADTFEKVPVAMCEPDLIGIKSMIRMVKETEDDAPETEIKPSDIIYISKLNPNVKEFIPKTPNMTENKDDNDKTTIDDKKSLSNEDLTKPVKTGDETLKPEEDINNLKEKICDAAKHNTYQHKKEKNAAIAALMQLYTNKNPIHSQSSKKPIKLYTPQFFTEHKAADFKGADEDISSDSEINNATTGEGLVKNSIETEETSQLIKDDTTNTENNHIEQAAASSTQSEVSEEEVIRQKSIDKVTYWLNGGSEGNNIQTVSPEPMMHMGRIGYKRKDTNSPSTVKSSVVEKKVSKQIKSYVPSEYAKELHKKYSDRNKEVEQKQIGIWDKLNEDLKRKDEDIIKRRNGDII